MIITTTYTAESKKERKALMLMGATLEDSGLDAHLKDGFDGGTTLTIKESRRTRKAKEAVEHPSEERERIQREAVGAAPKV